MRPQLFVQTLLLVCFYANTCGRAQPPGNEVDPKAKPDNKNRLLALHLKEAKEYSIYRDEGRKQLLSRFFFPGCSKACWVRCGFR